MLEHEKKKKQKNYRNKNNCRLDGKKLTPNIIYKANITSNQPKYKEKTYIRTAETKLKQIFNNHRKSLNLQHYQNGTEFSKGYLKIERSNNTPKTTWRIVRKYAPFKLTKAKCYACLNEKLEIASHKRDNL